MFHVTITAARHRSACGSDSIGSDSVLALGEESTDYKDSTPHMDRYVFKKTRLESFVIDWTRTASVFGPPWTLSPIWE